MHGNNLFILGRQEDLIKKIEAMDSLDGNGLMWLALQDMSLPAFQSGAKTVSTIIFAFTIFHLRSLFADNHFRLSLKVALSIQIYKTF